MARDFKNQSIKFYIEIFQLILTLIDTIAKAADRCIVEMKNNNINNFNLILKDILLTLSELKTYI